MTRRIAFVRWRSDVPSGGNRYDDALTAGLTGAGFAVRECPVAGSWPFPSAHDRENLRKVLITDAANVEQCVLIGNILGAAAPDLLGAAETAGRRVTMLMHYFAADDPNLPPTIREQIATDEAAAVNAVTAVIATSEWAATEVTKRYGRKDVVVAKPGVEPAELAPGSLRSVHTPHLLWLGGLTPTKDPFTFVQALAELCALDWTAQIVGPATIDPQLTHEVRSAIAKSGLSDRIEVTGARSGAALESIWSRTDLLVHSSLSEAYGMVVTEALARGIPSIVPLGTGAVEAQHGVGTTFPAGDSQALAEQLHAWFTRPSLQKHWRDQAVAQRDSLSSWQQTAQTVASVLASESTK